MTGTSPAAWKTTSADSVSLVLVVYAVHRAGQEGRGEDQVDIDQDEHRDGKQHNTKIPSLQGLEGHENRNLQRIHRFSNARARAAYRYSGTCFPSFRKMSLLAYFLSSGS